MIAALLCCTASAAIKGRPAGQWAVDMPTKGPAASIERIHKSLYGDVRRAPSTRDSDIRTSHTFLGLRTFRSESRRDKGIARRGDFGSARSLGPGHARL